MDNLRLKVVLSVFCLTALIFGVPNYGYSHGDQVSDLLEAKLKALQASVDDIFKQKNDLGLATKFSPGLNFAAYYGDFECPAKRSNFGRPCPTFGGPSGSRTLGEGLDSSPTGFRHDRFLSFHDGKSHEFRITGLEWKGYIHLPETGLYRISATSNKSENLAPQCFSVIALAGTELPIHTWTSDRQGSVTTELELEIPEPGYYRFRFWRSCNAGIPAPLTTPWGKWSSVSSDIQLVLPGARDWTRVDDRWFFVREKGGE